MQMFYVCSFILLIGFNTLIAIIKLIVATDKMLFTFERHIIIRTIYSTNEDAMNQKEYSKNFHFPFTFFILIENILTSQMVFFKLTAVCVVMNEILRIVKIVDTSVQLR